MDNGRITLLAALLALLLCGCSRKVYVPVESKVYHTDTLYRSQLRIDSVYFRDSVTLIRRGDTVYYTKYRDRLRYRDRIDTVYRSVIDTARIAVPYPVERRLSMWERAKMQAGGWAMGILGAVLLLLLILFIRRRCAPRSKV